MIEQQIEHQVPAPSRPIHKNNKQYCNKQQTSEQKEKVWYQISSVSDLQKEIRGKSGVLYKKEYIWPILGGLCMYSEELVLQQGIRGGGEKLR